MPNSEFDLQPTHLANAYVELRPLRPEDREALFSAASDPLIWEQHPNKERYRRDQFDTYFAGALESKGAFVVHNRKDGAVIGCSRYYELDQQRRTVAIGYTFLTRAYWGTPYNRALKLLMLEYAFRFVDEVLFHVGVNNLRSRKAMEKLGAEMMGTMDKAYYGEQPNVNVLYRMTAAMIVN